MYPGLFNDLEKAGVNSLTILLLGSTNSSSTEFNTFSILSLGATPLRIEKLCDSKSILHSVFS